VLPAFLVFPRFTIDFYVYCRYNIIIIYIYKFSSRLFDVIIDGAGKVVGATTRSVTFWRSRQDRESLIDRIADRWIGGRSSVDRQDYDRWSVGR
jgi:hypothetical protein